MVLLSPTSLRQAGFLPIHNNHSDTTMNRQPSGAGSYRTQNNDHVVNIPLTPMMTNVSTGARKEGQTITDSPDGTTIRQHIGRRRAREDITGDSTLVENEGVLTTMGKFYDKILRFSIVTRYLLYILPLGLALLVPILVSIYAAPKATIGGVRMKWFFIWLEIVHCSLWVSKLVSKGLPKTFQALIGVVSSGVKKYSLVIKALEVPLSLLGWAVASLCSFLPLMTRNADLPGDKFGITQPWQDRLNKVLVSCLISTVIIVAEKLLIQVVSVDYHRRQFALRIKNNKENIRFLSQLYEVSRNLFPEYTEFAEEDYIIHQGIANSLIPGKKKSGSATPMRQFIGNVNIVQDKVTSAFGGIAQEVIGNKNVFNTNSAYAMTTEALRRKKPSEALARRIWMSFVPEGNSALTLADLKEVMGPELETQAQMCFESLDRDGNGDVSLEEMSLHVKQLHTERRDVAKSMQDVDDAISALDNLLMFIVFILVVIVFVVAQQSSVGTTIAGAGTVLISLSFVFALTAQEILASCIFLFVKHPYSVGDRVDLDNIKYIVDHISLLYTVFRRVDNHKTTQIPNNILNTKVLENVTRSDYMQEQLSLNVHYDTSFEDIQKLKHELMLFTRENSRDFQPDLDVEVAGINNLDMFVLRIDIKHRGNWAEESLTLQRRSRFMCALAMILKKIPIYAPGGGDPSVGEQGKPMYTVQIPDDSARVYMDKARKDKLAKRWDFEEDDSSDDDDDNSKGKEVKTTSSSSTAIGLDMNLGGLASPFTDPRPNTRDGTRTLRRTSTESSNRQDDLEEVRGLLRRESTKGRRKPSPASGYNAGYASQHSGYQPPH